MRFGAPSSCTALIGYGYGDGDGYGDLRIRPTGAEFSVLDNTLALTLESPVQ
jgi:hypothetical protein